jgi:hypothetical protein
VRAEGWCRDPYGIHGDRWYSDGQPTSLVRDDGIESRDPPPSGLPPAEPVPLDLSPSDASDMMRADDSWTSFFADEDIVRRTEQEQARKLWMAALGFGVGAVCAIVPFLRTHLETTVRAAMWVVGGAWSAGSAVVVRRRKRGAGARLR